jgi:protein ImuB
MLPIDLRRRRRLRQHTPTPGSPSRASRSPDGRGPAAEPALLLWETVGQRQVVAARCARAARAGVRPGMPIGEARALLPGGAAVEPADRAADAHALERLGFWAHRFSPVVALDEPDGLFIDVTGCARVFKGEDRLLHGLRQRLGGMGVRTRAAIAPTFAAAAALARFGPDDETILDVPADASGVGAAHATYERIREAVRPLPVESLRLDERTLAGLADVGVRRVGELLDVPRPALASRFGAELRLRIDQLLGRALEPMFPLRPVEPVRAERVFTGPTTRRDAVERTVRELLAALCAQLREQERGAQAVVVELDTPGLAAGEGRTERLRITLSRASRDAEHLWSLLRPRLERAQLGHGVEGVVLIAARTARLEHRQRERWRTGVAAADGASASWRGDRAAGEFIDVLTAKLGAGRVLTATLAASHLPERTAAFCPAAQRDASPTHAAVTPADRPTVLLEKPLPAEVVLLAPDGPVLRVRCPGLGAEADRTVVACAGPERIAPEWWRHRDGARSATRGAGEGSDGGGKGEREYLRAVDDRGVQLWLCRSLVTGAWYVHGVWA